VSGERPETAARPISERAASEELFCRPAIQLGVSLVRYAPIGVGSCRLAFKQGTGEAIWSD